MSQTIVGWVGRHHRERARGTKLVDPSRRPRGSTTGASGTHPTLIGSTRPLFGATTNGTKHACRPHRLAALLKLARRAGVAICLLLLAAWAASTVVNYRAVWPGGSFYFGRGRVLYNWNWSPGPQTAELSTGWHLDDMPWDDSTTLPGHFGLIAPVGPGRDPMPSSWSMPDAWGYPCVLVPLWLPLAAAVYVTVMLWWAGRAPHRPPTAEATGRRRGVIRTAGAAACWLLAAAMLVSHLVGISFNAEDNRYVLASGGLHVYGIMHGPMTQAGTHFMHLQRWDSFVGRSTAQAGAATGGYSWPTNREAWALTGRDIPRLEFSLPDPAWPPIWFPNLSQGNSVHICPYRLVVPLWPLLLLIAPPMLAAYIRRRHPMRDGCPKCGYNLTGNVSGVCPECGTAVARPSPAKSEQRE